MNRRNFLKSISSFLAAIPFMSFDGLQRGGIVGKPPIIAGVDKASPKGDYTAIMTIDSYDGVLLFNNMLPEKFDVAKEYYMKNVMQQDKFPCLVGAELEIEWIGFE